MATKAISLILIIVFAGVFFVYGDVWDHVEDDAASGALEHVISRILGLIWIFEAFELTLFKSFINNFLNFSLFSFTSSCFNSIYIIFIPDPELVVVNFF